MAKFRKIFIGHAAGNNYTEIGFFRHAVERGNWYGGNKPISNASMRRLSRLIGNEVIQISSVYPLSKQLWVVYEPTIHKSNNDTARIIAMYERASTLSNTDPIEAEELLNIARDNEREYWIEHSDKDTDSEESLMPHSFYLDVVFIIRSRGAAARAGRDRH